MVLTTPGSLATKLNKGDDPGTVAVALQAAFDITPARTRAAIEQQSVGRWLMPFRTAEPSESARPYAEALAAWNVRH